MFCDNCGNPIEDQSQFCPECGSALRSVPIFGSGQASTSPAQIAPIRTNPTVSSQKQALPIKESPQSSAAPQAYHDITNSDTPPVTPASMTIPRAFRRLLMDPVNGLCISFEGLGEGGSIMAGLMLCISFGLSIATASRLASAGFTITGEKGFLSPSLGMFTDQYFMTIWLLLSTIPFSMFICSFILGKLLRAKGSMSAYIYTIGACLFPLEVVMVINGMLGLGNYEFQAVLILFALSYLILILYWGLTGLCGFSIRDGAPAVPFIITISAWLSKVFIVAIVSHS